MNDFCLPKVRGSMTPADVLVAPSPEDNWWIRCWAAVNACSAELCLHGFILEIDQHRKQLISSRRDVLPWINVE